MQNAPNKMTSFLSTMVMDSPLGRIELARNELGLVKIHFVSCNTIDSLPATNTDDNLLLSAASQLREYFARARREFDLPLAPQGTPFQRAAWTALQSIPYGVTVTYGDIAGLLGKPSGAARAVGHAIGQNPWAIVVPCHRVTGRDGSLTGYAGGLSIKAQLLDLELECRE